MIPDDVKARLDRYASSGVHPGGFLLAVLRNDLTVACGSADSNNRAALFDIVQYVYNHLPAACWGDKETVNYWMEERFSQPQ